MLLRLFAGAAPEEPDAQPDQPHAQSCRGQHENEAHQLAACQALPAANRAHKNQIRGKQQQQDAAHPFDDFHHVSSS